MHSSIYMLKVWIVQLLYFKWMIFMSFFSYMKHEENPEMPSQKTMAYGVTVQVVPPSRHVAKIALESEVAIL